MAELKYQCFYCRRYYTNHVERDNCVISHDLIYVPMSRNSLNRLLNFIISGNKDYLTPEVTEQLFRYVRHD